MRICLYHDQNECFWEGFRNLEFINVDTFCMLPSCLSSPPSSAKDFALLLVPSFYKIFLSSILKIILRVLFICSVMDPSVQYTQWFFEFCLGSLNFVTRWRSIFGLDDVSTRWNTQDPTHRISHFLSVIEKIWFRSFFFRSFDPDRGHLSEKFNRPRNWSIKIFE